MSRVTHPASLAALDPSLPDLARLVDAGEMRGWLERWWLEGGSPAASSSSAAAAVAGTAAAGCTLEHVRWSPGTECVAVYRLPLERPDGAPATTLVGVRASPEALHAWDYRTDPALEGTPAAADLECMRDLLQGATDSAGSWRLEPVRYRPSSRCVLRYELPGVEICYAKVLADDGSRRAAMVHPALGEELAVPVLAVSPPRQMILLRDAGGPSIGSLPVDGKGGEQRIQAAGRLLSRLHSSDGPPAEERSLANDTDSLREHVAAMERANPATASRFRAAIARLERHAHSRRPAVPSHGAFRLDQLHLSPRGGPVMIDLDSYCYAEPERDAGNLLAYLCWRAIRAAPGSDGVSRARDGFLAGYAAGGRELDPARTAVHEAASLLKIAGRRCRSLTVHQWQHLPSLVSRAGAVLDLAEDGS